MASELHSDSLSEHELRVYNEDGFVLIENFFTADELLPVLNEIETRVDALATRLLESGKIQDNYPGLDVWHRLTALDTAFPGAAVLIHTEGVMGPALGKLFTNPRLLNLVSQLIGPEIAGHPVWNVRSKTPGNALANVPWHQDTAYLAAGSERTVQPTAWIPLLDTTEHNGTLRLLRGGHRSGVVFPHHLERTRAEKTSHDEDGGGDARSWYLYIKDADLPAGERVFQDCKFGSFILFGNMIPHCAGANRSDVIRWSVDLRWQRPQDFSGFETVKSLLPMRSAAQPDLVPDFDAFNACNRHDNEGTPTHDQFSANVTGPWLSRWQ
eukprot:TRINITY_DN10138_c0_g1_i1.p1 TRINITY_DN10138_c0_g1~~TRINITY_DN10138_c0_g1_i1.p1  ORF type:complete len:325 (-),score=37.49 TRINITY_DN10138_c0_g1_i1:149-1123(-)